MSIIVEPKSNLVVPASMKPVEVDQHGPYTRLELVPWKGVMFQVGKIVALQGGVFTLVLVPVGITKGQVKRINGKKGKKAAKRKK